MTTDVRIAGTAEAGGIVSVSDGLALLGTTTADGSGAWSFAPSGLAGGAHTLAAAMTDAAGNTGKAMLALSYVVPPASMAAPVTAARAMASVGALAGMPSLAKDLTPMFDLPAIAPLGSAAAIPIGGPASIETARDLLICGIEHTGM